MEPTWQDLELGRERCEGMWARSLRRSKGGSAIDRNNIWHQYWISGTNVIVYYAAVQYCILVSILLHTVITAASYAVRAGLPHAGTSTCILPLHGSLSAATGCLACHAWMHEADSVLQLKAQVWHDMPHIWPLQERVRVSLCIATLRPSLLKLSKRLPGVMVYSTCTWSKGEPYLSNCQRPASAICTGPGSHRFCGLRVQFALRTGTLTPLVVVCHRGHVSAIINPVQTSVHLMVFVVPLLWYAYPHGVGWRPTHEAVPWREIAGLSILSRSQITKFLGGWDVRLKNRCVCFFLPLCRQSAMDWAGPFEFKNVV